MIQEAGADHVIFSRKLLVMIGVIFISTAILFFWVEQTRISINVRAANAVVLQTKKMQLKNEELERSKASLEEGQDELINNYESMLSTDTDGLNTEQIDQLKETIQRVQAKLSLHTKNLGEKEANLQEQEERLKEFQFKVQQKQSYIDKIAKVLASADVEIPDGIGLDEEVDKDFEWEDDDFRGNDADDGAAIPNSNAAPAAESPHIDSVSAGAAADDWVDDGNIYNSFDDDKDAGAVANIL